MNFEARAKVYERGARAQRWAAGWLAEWVEPAARGLDALELGAGTGLFTRALVAAGHRRLAAMDAAPAMVREGRRNAPGAQWFVGDAWEPDIEERYDRLYAASLLQWAPDPPATLARWRSLMRPGGRLRACLFVEGSLIEFQAVDPAFSALRWRSPAQWRALFEAAGWDVARWGVAEARFVYRDAREALRAVHDAGAARPGRFGVAGLRRFLAACEKRREAADGMPQTWRALRLEAAEKSEKGNL